MNNVEQSNQPLKVIGIHKQQGIPTLIMNCALVETAEQKKKEIEDENIKFFQDFEKFQLSLQPFSAREANIDDPQKYNEYLRGHQTDTQVKVQEYIQANAPEFVDFNIYII